MKSTRLIQIPLLAICVAVLSGCPQARLNTVTLKNDSADFTILEWRIASMREGAEPGPNLLALPLAPGGEAQAEGLAWGEYVLKVVYARHGILENAREYSRTATLGYSGDGLYWAFEGPGIHRLTLHNLSSDRDILAWYVAGQTDVGLGENVLLQALEPGQSYQITGLSSELYTLRIVHAAHGATAPAIQVSQQLDARNVDMPQAYDWRFYNE